MSIPELVETEAQSESRLRTARGRRALSLAPELAQHLRSKIYPGDGRTERGVDVPDERTTLLTQVVDDCDHLFVLLVEWASFWSIRLNIATPASHVVAARNFQDSHRSAGYTDADVLGFRAGTTPGGARALVQIIVTWLLLHDDQIGRTQADYADQFHDEIASEVWALRSAHQLTEQRPVSDALARFCEVCGLQEMRATYFREPLVHAERRREFDGVFRATHDEKRDPRSAAGKVILSAVDGVDVRCGHCGWTVKPRPDLIARWLVGDAPTSRVVPA